MTKPIALVGLDIAKSVFQLHGADQDGRPLLRRKLRRDEVEPYFAKLPPCLIGIEACPGSHHWARTLRQFGHDVRLLPAQYVRPYADGLKDEATLKAVNTEIMLRIQESGVAILSDTTVSGRHCLRVAINNHRTTRQDLSLLLSEVLRTGERVAHELARSAAPVSPTGGKHADHPRA